MDRRVDLALLLEDDSIFYLEFQGRNLRLMVYRTGLYAVLLAMRMRWKRVRGVVLYVGEPRVSMRTGFKLGLTQLGFELIDIREIDAELLIASHHPNVLALLAGCGDTKIQRIVERLGRLEGEQRDLALAQLELLAGLGNVVKDVKHEVENMGAILHLKKNSILIQWQEEAHAEIRQAEERGLEVPKWVRERIAKSDSAQLDGSTTKILTADTLEGVIGKR